MYTVPRIAEFEIRLIMFQAQQLCHGEQIGRRFYAGHSCTLPMLAANPVQNNR